MNSITRNEWVDRIKFIGIIAVILGRMDSPFGSYILSWHMPLFFLISGFFINLDFPFKKFLQKDFARLMLPYFVFALCGLTVEIMKRIALHRPPLILFSELKGIFWAMDANGLRNHCGFVLWFLPALFMARLGFYGIYYLCGNLGARFSLAVILFWLGFKCDLPFAIDHGMNAVIWVMLGYEFYRNFKNKIIPWPVILLSPLYYVFITVLPLDLARKFYPNLWVNIPWVVIFSLVLISASQTIKLPTKVNQTISRWGAETLILFVAHPYTNNVAYLISEKTGPHLWLLELLLSLGLLQIVLLVKKKFEKAWVFRYV